MKEESEINISTPAAKVSSYSLPGFCKNRLVELPKSETNNNDNGNIKICRNISSKDRKKKVIGCSKEKKNIIKKIAIRMITVKSSTMNLFRFYDFELNDEFARDPIPIFLFSAEELKGCILNTGLKETGTNPEAGPGYQQK